MVNLLHANLAEEEIATVLASTSGQQMMPPLGEAEWIAVRENPLLSIWIKPLIERAAAEAEEPLPVLSDELYADYLKTGARRPFEAVYFERRHRMARSAFALLLGDEKGHERAKASFLGKVTAIMDEPAWCLPAHAGMDPSGKNPMYIDLFGAETANTLAELLVIFHRVLPEDLRRRIKTRLRAQFFENYIGTEEPFRWETASTNWNAVCHQGVLGAALTCEEDHHLVARLLALAAARLPRFLDGFGDDGSTSEGPAYWGYGFGWFAELNEQLERRTGGAFSFFEGDAKIRRMAKFGPAMTLAGGHCVNFSDCAFHVRHNPSLLTLLGGRLADSMLSAEGVLGYRHQSVNGIDPVALRPDFFNLSRLALRAPGAGALQRPEQAPVAADVYLPDYGVVVARGTDMNGHYWEFAAKGGHNGEHHNHNDCGSFLLNVDRVRLCLEIGAPEYTKGYFHEARYTSLAARSLGHSVPLVNGCEQGEGREFAANVVKADVGGDRVEFVVELAKCYPAAARCNKLQRTFVFEKSAGRLTVTDVGEFNGDAEMESVLICPDLAIRQDGGVTVTHPKAAPCVTPLEGTRLVAVDTCAYRGHRGTDEKISRVRLTPARGMSASLRVSYEIRVG